MVHDLVDSDFVKVKLSSAERFFEWYQRCFWVNVGNVCVLSFVEPVLGVVLRNKPALSGKPPELKVGKLRPERTGLCRPTQVLHFRCEGGG